ncbi:MAG: peptidoglycan recognition family protein [Phycisphaerae bacterium]|nr:peptidoglycan recognition family protein [Phycisphaerae bacterium]MDD5381805.1 peptidoglycan recognition family protein [Phycisphaerae bacterium]
MYNRILIACGCLVVLSGCMANEPMPQITYDDDYKSIETVKPKLSTPSPSRTVSTGNALVSQDWVPPSSVEKKWTAIIIHHSGTKNGDSAIFDKWHRENNHWQGVGYDFVIGNGSNSGDGLVEVTYRWQKQVTGAHVGGTPGNWANKDGIGICLVGDFNKTQPTNSQMQSLVKLVRFLQSRYKIPKNKIYGHKTTPGAGTVTDCPGKNFPMTWLKSQVLP